MADAPPLAATPPQELFFGGEDLSVLPLVQKGFILAIRGIERHITVATTGEEVKAMVAEAYPPPLLFDPDLAALPSIYLELRTWLNKHGAALGTHPSRRIINLLANKMYDLDADREEAKELAKQLLQTRSRRNASGGSAASQGEDNSGGRASAVAHTTSIERHAHNMGTRYRDERSKFTGATDQSFSEHIGNYQQICRDYGLSNDQKLLLLHNIFGGEAKRFYDTRVEHRVDTFSEAISRMSVQYDTYVRQMEAKNELGSLRLEKLVSGGKTEKEALTYIYESITKLSPQLPEIHRGDGHKLMYLRAAVVGIPWTRLPLARLSTTPMDFQQLYDELKGALQLEQEYRPGASDAEVSSVLAPRGGANSIMYAGQGMYGRPNKGVGATRSPKLGGASVSGQGGGGGRGKRFDPLSVAGCFNCDSPSHIMKQCPHPVNAVKATQRRVAYYDKKLNGGRAAVAAVLYQLSLQVHPDVTMEDVCDLEDVLLSDDTTNRDATSAVQPAAEFYEDDQATDDDGSGAPGTSRDHAVHFAPGA